MNRFRFASAGFLLLLAAARVSGCTCEFFGDGTPKSSLRHPKAVFLGEVLEIRPATPDEREDGANTYIVKLRVERYWKGVKTGEIVVETDMTGCGPYFEVGRRYVVYGRGKRLNTTCMRMRRIEEAEDDMKKLGPSRQLNPK